MIRAVATAIFVLALVGACDSSDQNSGSMQVGCELSSAASMEAALDSSQLSSTGQGTMAKPDPETGQVTCDTERTDRAGHNIHVQVQMASAADLKARDNWLGEAPRTNPGCEDPSFVKDGELAGVSCVDKAASGYGMRVYVVSTTHTIVVELSLRTAPSATDRKAAFAIAQSVQQTIA